MPQDATPNAPHNAVSVNGRAYEITDHAYDCLLYTSDAADERVRV